MRVGTRVGRESEVYAVVVCNYLRWSIGCGRVREREVYAGDVRHSPAIEYRVPESTPQEGSE